MTAALILVSGPPAAGKTTLSRRLAQEFRLPLVAKDDIKETLFDTLGVRDLAWTRDVGRASIALLWQFVEVFLQADHSVIAESNFHAALDAERLTRLQEKHDFIPWQLHCTASAAVLWTRAEARERDGTRHPGHRGVLHSSSQELQEHRDELERSLADGVWDPLQIKGETLTLDTTNWDRVEWGPVQAAVRALLGAERHTGEERKTQ